MIIIDILNTLTSIVLGIISLLFSKWVMITILVLVLIYFIRKAIGGEKQ